MSIVIQIERVDDLKWTKRTESICSSMISVEGNKEDRLRHGVGFIKAEKRKHEMNDLKKKKKTC